MKRPRPATALAIGMVAVAGASFVSASGAPGFAKRLDAAAERALAEAGAAAVDAQFVSPGGFASRHPLLSGGKGLDEDVRGRAARAVASVPGVGGVRWADGTALAQSAVIASDPLHCQEDVEALLRARTIRFEESSARIDRASGELIDEVAAALRPCLGSIIAITGHTDSSGSEVGNLSLSQERAEAVRDALRARGIPADGLRARGMGSRSPVDGLPSSDPANRRIEFSVIATRPLKPSPVDTPAPR